MNIYNSRGNPQNYGRFTLYVTSTTVNRRTADRQNNLKYISTSMFTSCVTDTNRHWQVRVGKFRRNVVTCGHLDRSVGVVANGDDPMQVRRVQISVNTRANCQSVPCRCCYVQWEWAFTWLHEDTELFKSPSLKVRVCIVSAGEQALRNL